MVWLHKKLLIIIIIVVGAAAKIAPGRAGERTNYLNYFGVGARSIGLNHACTASCNDYTAPFWNPAVMDFFSTMKIGGMKNKMSLNRQINYLACVVPTEKYGAFALSLAIFSIQDIEARTSNTEQPDDYFNCSDKTISLSYAYRIMPTISIGSSIKIFDYGIQKVKATGTGIDFALIYIPVEELRFGLVIQDPGSKLRWSTGVDEIFSETYRLGISCQPFNSVSFSCDFHKIGKEKIKAMLSTELVTLNLLKIRFGVDKEKLAGGLGIILPIKNIYLNFNYAIITDRLNVGMSDVFDFSLVF